MADIKNEPEINENDENEEDLEVIEQSQNGGEMLGKYKIMQYIEKGSFGDVHLAANTETGESVAIKIVDKRKAIGVGSKRKKKVVLDELNILRVKHPAIIELKDFFVTKDYLVLVMEYCGGGDLFTLVARDPIPEKRAKYIFKQILEGIGHLHKINIIHRDIKLENILLKEKGSDEIKITDFGMSRIVSRANLATTQCGTVEYSAPEVFKFQPYGRECDYWSLGILLYDLLSSELPFNSLDEIVGCEAKPIAFTSPKWDTISEQAKDLIRNLVVYNPDGRWTIDQALQSDWIKDIHTSNTVNDVTSPSSATLPTAAQSLIEPKQPEILQLPQTPPRPQPQNINTNGHSNENENGTRNGNGNSKKHKRQEVSSPSSFGMSLRKRIKVKQPYDV